MAKKTKKSNGLRDEFFQADINKKYELQKGKCVYQHCKRINGKQPPPLYLNFEKDHKLAPQLYKALKVEGDPNGIANLQLLHPDCHAEKTVTDRKILALYNKNRGNKDVMKNLHACVRRHKDLNKIRDCVINTFDDFHQRKYNQ